MSQFSRQDPPPVGTLIAVELMLVSKCCGSTLVGYSAGSDNTYLYLSYKTNGSKDSQIGWNAITGISAIQNGEICIEI